MNSISEFKPTFMTLEEHGPVVVARINRPQLSEEDNIEELWQEFVLLVEHFGCRRLALDLNFVNIVTSSALGKLISLHRNLHRREGRLVVCGAQGMVKDALSTSRLNDYFTMAPSVNDAVVLLTDVAV